MGVILGLNAAYKFGYKSYVGRLIYVLSGGLFLQVVGQNVANYLYVQDISIYPSAADFAFFGSIILYIYASFLLLSVTGTYVAIKTTKNKLYCLLIFFIILTISYYFLLNHIAYDFSQPLIFLLDFGYPLGQAIYVSLVLVVFFLTKDYLGGAMRVPIFLLLAGLFTQYLSDYLYSFLNEKNAWMPGGFNDYMYFLGYFFLTYSFVSLSAVFKKIK